MPIYEFQNEDGVTEEHYFEMSEAPTIGSSIVIDDRLMRRLPPWGIQPCVKRDAHFVARSQPTCNPDGTVPEGVTRAPRYDMNPKSDSYLHALFDGKREVEEYCARSEGRVNYGK